MNNILKIKNKQLKLKLLIKDEYLNRLKEEKERNCKQKRDPNAFGSPSCCPQVLQCFFHIYTFGQLNCCVRVLSRLIDLYDK